MSESAELRRQIKVAAQNAEIACRNEETSRKRVESLERVLGGFLGLPLRHRLRWMLFGMPAVPPKVEEPVAQEVADVH